MEKEELSMEMVCSILADIMNDLESGDDYAYEKGVQRFKDATELTEQQESMIRNSLAHLEMITNSGCKIEGLVGFEANIILWTLAEDWHCLNHRTLGDKNSNTGTGPLSEN